MRLSVDKGDAGYPAFRALRTRPIVTVNGAEVRWCFTADTNRGIAVVADLDARGKPQMNAKRNAVKRKVLRGKVEIAMEREGWDGG